MYVRDIRQLPLKSAYVRTYAEGGGWRKYYLGIGFHMTCGPPEWDNRTLLLVRNMGWETDVILLKWFPRITNITGTNKLVYL